MNTTIIDQLQLPNGQSIRQVLPINEKQYVVWIYKRDRSFLKIVGDSNEIRHLPRPSKRGWHGSNYIQTADNNYTSLFAYKKGFGLTTGYGNVWLWEHPGASPCVSKIGFPFGKDAPYKNYLSNVFYEASSNMLVVGFSDEVSTYRSKYWTTYDVRTGGLFSKLLPRSLKPSIGLQLLPEEQFPSPTFEHTTHHWLTIQATGSNSNGLLFHTNGGSNTRAKSGVDFDFSIISTCSPSGTWLSNRSVAEGHVSFGTDQQHFLVITKDKKKALIYQQDTFEQKHEISLTPKQSLGAVKANKSGNLGAAIYDKKLYLWRDQHLTINQLDTI